MTITEIRAGLMAAQIVRRQVADFITSVLFPEQELAVWTLIHRAVDESFDPWEKAETLEEILRIFAENVQSAFLELVPATASEAQVEDTATEAEQKLIVVPEPEAAVS